ncbi:MAG TPA: hypothetical protein VMZ71_11210 [Gemmataceae bacterium]|nr:hypothetical protein [Gemmataceae bacterium]
MKLFTSRWGLAVVGIGLGAPPAVAADPPAAKPPEPTVFGKMFGKKPAGPAVRSGPVVTAPHAPEVLADALRAEQEAYLRRLSVCGELRRVAGETNDDALTRQAEELERQAASVYNQRVAALGVPKVKAPMPQPSGLATLTPKAAADKLTAPANPVADTGVRTAEAREIIREVKP